jgi:hypothetical protein
MMNETLQMSASERFAGAGQLFAATGMYVLVLFRSPA